MCCETWLNRTRAIARSCPRFQVQLFPRAYQWLGMVMARRVYNNTFSICVAAFERRANSPARLSYSQVPGNQLGLSLSIIFSTLIQRDASNCDSTLQMTRLYFRDRHRHMRALFSFAFVLGAFASDISRVPGAANRFRSFVLVRLNYVARYASSPVE